MTLDPYNPDDPAFLASRDLDGDLTAQERRRLAEALAESAGLRDEADRYARVHELIGRWAACGPQIDWMTHQELVLGSLDDDESTLRKLDGLLAAWSGPGPVLDEDQFTRAVLREIGRRRIAPVYARVLRFGLPLAAAAVFLFVLTATLWVAPLQKPVAVVVLGHHVEPEGRASPRAEVSFARPEPVPAGEVGGGIDILTLGASPIVPRWGDSPL